MNVIHSRCSQRREIKPDLCPLLTEDPSEERKIIFWSKDERSCFWKATVIASNIPVVSWLLSSPRYSKNSNLGCILSRSILASVVPSNNITMKLILTSLLYIYCLKKYSAILLIKSLHPDSFSYDSDLNFTPWSFSSSFKSSKSLIVL